MGIISRLRPYIKHYKCYTLQKKFMMYTGIKGFKYKDEFVTLKEDGAIIIERGYSWNGCTPKYDVFGVVLGAPEGIINKRGYPTTYFPSCVHDVFYQISKKVELLPRSLVDRLFYNMLRDEKFQLAWLYYLLVRIFGRKSWGNS